MAKVKKVTGTSKVDTITVTGSYATVNKKKISIAASGVTVKAGKSNDIININGGGKTKAPNKFYGEAGNDTFVIGKTSTGVAVVKDFNKSGTDKVKVTGSTVKSVSLSGKNLIIKGGKSASLTLEGAKRKTISLEDSRGKYTMSSSAITLDKTFGGTLNSSTFLSSITNINGSKATKTVTVNAGSNIKTITGGSGINKVNLSGGTASVNTGAGNDVITVKGGNKHTLRGGTGSDQYVINSSITNSTRFTINQSDYKSKDADTLKLANVNRTDVTYGYLNGTLTIKHKTGGTITISGWNKNPFSKIVFKDGSSVTGATVTKNAVTEYNWALGNKVTVSAAALAAKLQINGYKDNDFVATLDSSGALVLRDVKGGALTITGWKNNKLTNVTFKAGSYTKSFTASAFNDRIFTVTALENGTVYSGGAGQRQQFNLELNASTDVTISSVSGSEDRIKLTDHHSTNNFSFRIEGNDFCIYDYDPKTDSQTGGKIVLTNYKENTVKAIEFDDITYHFVTGNDTISNVSDTYSDRYVFLDNDWKNRETAGEPWEVTVEDFTPGGALDFRFLPNNGRYYSIASEEDGQDMVLTYNYSPDRTTGATLGTIRLKNFFNADGTVNETTGFTKIRTIREVYSGNRSANAWDGWIWEQIRTDSGPQYRFLQLNAGTSGADTMDLGSARSGNGTSAWMYFAGDGDDTITAKEGDIVYGEAGADTILVTEHYGEAHGGIGNDTITIQSVNGNNRHHAVVRGDAGNDVINAYGSYHYINGGSGDDEIHIYSGENSEVMSHQNGISGSRGNDKIYIHAGDNHVANGGADNDEIYIYGGNNTWANGGDGTDTITVTGGTGHVLNGGVGSDIITVTGGTGHVLNGGVGSDRYVVDMDFTADTNLTVDQMNSDGADVDILQLSKVNKDDVEFAVENGTLTITHSNGGTITVEGWENHPLAQIQFADNQSMTADEINQELGYVGQNGIDWALGHTVILNAANLDPALQINGYKANDFVVTLNPDANQLVLADAQDGTITINNWDQNTLETITFTADGHEDSFTADAFNDRIFTVTALENGTVYSGGAGQRQQFNLELNASTDVTISSVSGSEDRIKLTDHHSTENFNFRIEGNDFCIYDYDPETDSQTGGKIVLKNYKENTVKAIEFDDTTYHFVTGNDTISNVSDTHSDRYVFLDNDWRNRETAGEPWEVTVEDFTPSGALDFRFLPNNGRYYSIASEADGQDMVLTYKYSPTPTTGATLGTIRLKNFFNADGTVNETTGFTKIRTIREVYSGNRSANAWDSWVWEQIRTDSGPQYRFLRLNAGTSGDDTVDLGAARPAGGASAWMYFAGAGDDTITAKEGDIVYGEAGADTILVTEHYGEAHGGIGNDTITIQSVNGNNRHHAVVRGDDGDDVINAYGSYHYINGGADNDEIHIYSGENSEVMSHQNGISGSRGNDKIYIHAGDNHVANGGADNDEIYIYGGNNTRANGGDGTDTITVTGGNGHVLVGGAGSDVITVTGGTGHVLNGGVGSDSYVFDMDFTADTNLTVDQMNSDGADVDILQLSKVNKDDVEFAVENGTLTITHSNGGTITVEGWGNHPLAQIQFADNQSMTADEINEALAEPAVVTVTQQSVMKKFMNSLDNSNMIMEDVEGALNTAVAYASNNVYDSWNGLVNSFVDEVKKYGATTTAEAKDFLATYCGIDLDNEDTGSITGADAGGAAVKTAISIVPEDGTMADAIAPTTATTTINGLTFEWPAAIENDKQQAIINALNTWWAKEGLGLIEESYGLSFNEAGTTVNKIKVEFYTDANVSTLAAVYNSSYSDGDHAGEATTLWLRINMAKFNDIDLDDVNGYAGQTSGYLDRTIAHELTHAVMAANITGFNKLPDSISEGAAELVHGIDDFRTTTISALALKANVEQLETALLNTEPPTYATSYSGGYMLLRYFAKQVADRANNVEVNASPNVAATVDFDMIEQFTSSSSLSSNAMTVSDLGENSLAIASIQNSLIDFADSRISDSLAGVQQEDKQNSSLFITGNV